MRSQSWMLLPLLFHLECLAQSSTLGPALTASALKIQGAISTACNATSFCVRFVTDVIPRCQRLQGDPGCWCGNHDPLHYCAICMSSPTDNQTSPDQTADAIAGHNDYHVSCNAYETFLNASSTATVGVSSTSSPTATNAAATGGAHTTKTPIEAIVGGVVGGGVAVAIGVLVLVIWLRQRKKNAPHRSSISIFSAAGPPQGVSQTRQYSSHEPQASFGRRGSTLSDPSYAPARTAHQGMYSPPLSSANSYSHHPEPMVPH